jgi:hypothetical protein
MRKMPIHSTNRPIITEARPTQEVPSWSPPNQPIFTLKDYQQLFGNLPITPFNQLTFYYKDHQESEKQETSPPIIFTNPPTHNANNLPTYNINSSIGTAIIPLPSPTTNPSITFGNVPLPLWLWRELYQQFSPLPKPSAHEQETSPPASILKDLRQLLSHLPKTPLPKLPEGEPREAPLAKQEQKPKQTGGIGWIYEQRPAFTPVVFYNPAKGTIYTPPIAFQPIIPKSPPTYHVVVETNSLTF